MEIIAESIRRSIVCHDRATTGTYRQRGLRALLGSGAYRQAHAAVRGRLRGTAVLFPLSLHWMWLGEHRMDRSFGPQMMNTIDGMDALKVAIDDVVDVYSEGRGNNGAKVPLF